MEWIGKILTALGVEGNLWPFLMLAAVAVVLNRESIMPWVRSLIPTIKPTDSKIDSAIRLLLEHIATDCRCPEKRNDGLLAMDLIREALGREESIDTETE